MKQNHLHIMPDAESLVNLIYDIEISDPKIHSLSDLIELDLLILEQSSSVVNICVRCIENQKNISIDLKDKLISRLLERVRYNSIIDYQMICEEAIKLKPYPPNIRFEDVCGLVMAYKTRVRIYLTDKGELIKNFIEQKRDKFNSEFDDIQILNIDSLIAYIRDMDIGSEKLFINIKTPHEKGIKLPQGSTVIDFAYKIHTHVGHCCSKATVNGAKVSLDTVLNENDLVNITKNLEETENPSFEWLEFARTPYARKKIKHWHKMRNIDEGKVLFTREVGERYHLYGDVINDISTQLGCENVDKLYERLGRKDIDINKAAKLAIRYGDENIKSEANSYFVIDEQDLPIQYYDGGIINDFDAKGNQNYAASVFAIAYCCSPLPGQAIVGILNEQHKKMIIHQSNCRKLNSTWTENQKILRWNCNDCTFSIKIVMIDREGILSNIISKFKEQRIHYNIRSISPSVQIDFERRSVAKIHLLIRDRNKIDTIKRELANMNDICQVIVKGIYPGTWKFKYD